MTNGPAEDGEPRGRRLMLRRRRRDASMTVVEHLEELRRRLFISLISVSVAAIAGFVLFERIFRLLLRPYCRALETLPANARPNAIVPRAGAPGELDCALVFSSPVDPFLTRLKVAFFAGLMLALPVVLWQLWRFVTPGLKPRERRLGAPFVISSVLLFGLGAVFAFSIIPRGLSFLFSFGGESLVPLLTVDRYLGFLMLLILAFGLSFEFPLLLIFLAGARVITTTQMRKWRRYVYFGIVVFAAVVTPTQDPYTLLLMSVPLALFYEASIVVARLLKR